MRYGACLRTAHHARELGRCCERALEVALKITQIAGALAASLRATVLSKEDADDPNERLLRWTPSQSHGLINMTTSHSSRIATRTQLLVPLRPLRYMSLAFLWRFRSLHLELISEPERCYGQHPHALGGERKISHDVRQQEVLGRT